MLDQLVAGDPAPYAIACAILSALSLLMLGLRERSSTWQLLFLAASSGFCFLLDNFYIALAIIAFGSLALVYSESEKVRQVNILLTNLALLCGVIIFSLFYAAFQAYQAPLLEEPRGVPVNAISVNVTFDYAPLIVLCMVLLALASSVTRPKRKAGNES